MAKKVKKLGKKAAPGQKVVKKGVVRSNVAQGAGFLTVRKNNKTFSKQVGATKKMVATTKKTSKSQKLQAKKARAGNGKRRSH